MLYIVLTIIAVLIDQLVKWWVTATIPLNQEQAFIPGLFNLMNLHNSGAAWSILEGQRWFFFVVTIVAIGVISWLMFHYRGQRWIEISLCLILAGTLGNFVDRLRFGYVVDMFEFLPVSFPVFNVADALLTVGVILLAIMILKEDD